MKTVNALYLRRVLDILSVLVMLASLFVDWKGALICYIGCVIWCIANKVRSTVNIWSWQTINTARRYDEKMGADNENR